ncbi:Transposable element P transposase [Amphibalanus amphitrite]|uniref:Transposable element P transposase n=1 Tax=Amphibalanus amphitrite TaxID=1232801 RepID=A0A6A4W7J6_AMPAM|nr:Transposable element P transposase [Amphibalanus amphitrite]
MGAQSQRRRRTLQDNGQTNNEDGRQNRAQIQDAVVARKPKYQNQNQRRTRQDGDAKGERLKRRTIMKTVNSLLRQQHEQPDCSSVAGENGQPEIPEGNRRILKSSAQVRRLKKEIARLRAQRRSEQLKWQRHIARLRREICQLRRRVASGSLLEGRMGDILSQQQLRRLSTGRRTCWKSEDVSKAIGLRCISRKAYAYVLHSMQIPLPSESTLSRWTRTFQLGLGGMIHAAVWVLQAAVQEMSAMDRVCCICFDEMSINRRPTYDQSADVVLCGGKLQLMMVRGVCAPWKQPFWQELDAPVTTEKLTAVVRTLEGLGLDVRAVTSDMGSTNEALWRDAGVNLQKTWISHPTDSTKKLWVFADVPHLVKLVRHHVVKDNGGLLVPDGCGGTVLLDAAPFRELRALDSGEMKICPKLTDLCIEARNQTAQRVYLATRLFSGTVATAMEAVLGKPAVARAVRIIDRWFDVLNSRCCSDPKLERQAYGSSEDAKAAQDSALRDMEHLIANARKPGARRLLGPASAVALLPFQRGILRSTASVRGLYEDLTRAYPGQLRFILTSRLNQDCLENAFSQLRGMGGQSTNPDAVEVRQRLRAMLMAPSALRAISCPERAVEVESGPTDYLSTGRPPVASVSANPRAPSMAELEGLTIEFISDEMDDDDAVEVDHSYSRATGAQQPADGDPGSELGLEREWLAFVAGYRVGSRPAGRGPFSEVAGRPCVEYLLSRVAVLEFTSIV